MTKIDLKKEYKQLYNPSAKEVVIITVPKVNYLMVDGKGDPVRSGEFQSAIETLFGLSYTLKFMLKKSRLAPDYVVMPLEGLWWADNMKSFTLNDRNSWKWTLMIMQPEFITRALVKEAMAEVAKKKKPPILSEVRFESLHEGKSVQIMHIGPFSTEGPTVARLHKFIKDAGGKLRDKHHEIYLSDFRRVMPEKMKTILRQPMK
jgi:hypothetical protein